MDTHGSRHLGDAGDGRLDLRGRHQHQIGKLVDNDHIVGQRFEIGVEPIRFTLGQGESFSDGWVLDRPVVEIDRPHVGLSQESIAPLHLTHRPAQGIGSFLGLGHHLGLEVWNMRVDAQLDSFRIDEDELHLVARRLVEDRGDHALETDALAGARGSSHQQMGSRRQIGVSRVLRGWWYPKPR